MFSNNTAALNKKVPNMQVPYHERFVLMKTLDLWRKLGCRGIYNRNILILLPFRS